MVVTEYQGGNETYTTETRQEGGRTSKVFGLLDMRYLKGIPGLLKAFEAVSHVIQHRRIVVEGLRPCVVGESTMGLSLIGYICVETSIQCLSGITTYGFFKFVTLLALITTLILWAVLLLQIHTRILKCDCFDWPFIEICYYGFIIVLYFFADVFLGIHACTIGHKAGDVSGHVLH
ncbi:hypothetical protein NP493_3699g00002 [Ridgeia piscesae]|uniref:MARVEL domain-containing protein n=1 Tax=Ridgeia piscesae TaxID=27915 RepID=A0AAD9MX69_RIDPI|nr:hypothetical protein NP493_3699g00002 [Ridgeia piscesae]